MLNLSDVTCIPDYSNTNNFAYFPPPPTQNSQVRPKMGFSYTEWIHHTQSLEGGEVRRSMFAVLPAMSDDYICLQSGFCTVGLEAD